MKNFSIAIIAMILLSFLSPVAAMQPKDDEVSVMIPVIIEFNDKVDKKLLENNGGKIKIEYKLRPAVAVSLPSKAIENLRENPNIKSIVNDIEIHTMEYGTSYSSDWGIKQIGADIVHTNDIKGETINVAVLDSGADLDHPDLVDNIAYSYDFSGRNDLDASDFGGHGTHTAGTIGALLNGNGVVGVAPDVNLYILKVFSDNGRGSYSDVIEALEWCYWTRNDPNTNNDIQIVSMSLGSEYVSGDPGFEGLVNMLYNAGILLVGAAGNSGSADDNVIYPARYENVIAVAATDLNNNKASFSSTGPSVEISAPGVYVQSTYLRDSYATMSGTSMATPHVAGTAALVMAANPGISNVQVRYILQNTADDLGDNGRDNLYGFGLVNADEAAVPISTNQSPIAVNDTYSIDEDNTLIVNGPGVLVNDTDAENDPLTAVLVAEANNGNVVLNDNGSFTYTSNTNFAGTDSFTYKANDGFSDSNIATVNIVVNPVNDAPVADNQHVITPEGIAVEIILTGSDVDGDNLTYIIITQPANGTLDGNTPIMTYTPESEYIGDVSFTFKVNDGEKNSSAATVSIIVTEAEPPIHIASIDMDLSTRKAGRNTFTHAIAVVTIVNASGVPVSGATVFGHWSNATSDYDSGVTDTGGNISLYSDEVKNAPSGTNFTFTVTDVICEGFIWNKESVNGSKTVYV